MLAAALTLALLAGSAAAAPVAPQAGPVIPRAAPAGSVAPRSDVPWTLCAAQPIYTASITPCAPSAADPNVCVLNKGSNYTLDIAWTPASVVDAPRSGVAGVDNGTDFAYPAQAFDACAYTACPLRNESIFQYAFPFHVFDSLAFDALVVNLTDGVFGPSVLCVELPVEIASS